MGVSKLTVLLLSIAAVMTISACDKRTKSGETVGQKIDKAIDKTNETAAAASDKIGAQMDKTGTAISGVASAVAANASATSAKAGEAIADGAISASINADLLKDPELSVLKIDVDAKQSAVVLNGLTPSEEARVRAVKIASAVKGVTRVENNLSVKKP